MSLFDAISHSFSTVATGGFSTHSASLAFFDSLLIETIANVFMVLAALNFTAHFLAWRGRTLLLYLRDAEVVAFLAIIVGITLILTIVLWLSNYYPTLLVALRYAAFQTISMITTTGFTTTNFADWPGLLPLILIYICFIGGCAGSTAGGIKVIRLLLLLKQAHREVRQLIHPRAVIAIKIDGKVVKPAVINAVWGFFALYVFSTVTLTALMVATGLDALSAYSAVASCLNVTGPGLGVVTTSFAAVSDTGKWLSVFTMALGRLEIFTLLVVLTPSFWRR